MMNVEREMQLKGAYRYRFHGQILFFPTLHLNERLLLEQVLKFHIITNKNLI